MLNGDEMLKIHDPVSNFKKYFCNKCKIFSGGCFDAEYLGYISSVQRWSLAAHPAYRRSGLHEVCPATETAAEAEDAEAETRPRLEHFTTARPRTVDRAKLLRRYLRHPAFSNSKLK